jgi:hypothetical protein
MKETIGKKSVGDIVTHVLLFIVLGGLTIIYMRTNIVAESTYESIMVYVTGGLSVILFFLAINEIMKPRAMIESDQKNLYLNYRHHTEEISLHDIVQAKAKRARSRAITYSYGKITIHTASDTHKIGNVSNCEDVASRIMHLVDVAKEKREEE